jgi:inhibitor of KinA
MPRAKGYALKFVPASDASLLVSFGERISVEPNEQVRRLVLLLEREPITGVRNVHPAYCSVLVVFEPRQITHAKLEAKLRDRLRRTAVLQFPPPRDVKIPVCYGGEFGPDLEEVAKLHAMTRDEVVALHGSVTYRAYFLGFTPGFAYLGELPEPLVTPRLPSPRKQVPAGSVGIAGNQTGVYPFATPGGWRLLGRTPLQIFRADREGLSLIAMGDRVRFVPISRERFAELEGECA